MHIARLDLGGKLTAFCLMAAAVALCQDALKPDLVLTGVITGADHHTYREVPFRVPDGISRLTVEFSYSGRDQRTTIDLGIFDGERFRGWSGGNKSTFTISATDATPSYLAGPVQAGEWKLLLGIPNIRPGVRSEFEAKIYFVRSGAAERFSSVPINPAAGWYRGDLHMHTAHSDGSCSSQSGKPVPCPVFKTLEAAANRGLDFIAVTDHNTVSQFDSLRELQPYFDRLLLIAGREITTFEGHANVYGATGFIDFRLTSPQVPTVKALLDQARALHALISINHPANASGESCMGCGWTARDTDFREIQAIEAINAGDAGGPTSGIPFWEAQLNRGFRLTAIGGSDNHHADVLNSASSIGHPTTVVYARDLSESGVLDGVRSGRVFIDAEGAKGRMLDLSATIGSTAVHMGDEVKAVKGAVLRFSVQVAAPAGSIVEVIEDGHKAEVVPDTAMTQAEETKNFDWTSDGARHWLRVNVRSPEGRLLSLGNPIYVNF